MICPRCGNKIRGAITYCDSCGAELTVYKKIMQSSNLYYNRGLSRANVRDLSGAIQMLKKSLEINKRNTMARNLLGLVYFELGETVAALGEWVVSKHFQPENNRADYYIEQIQSSPAKFDAVNQAIKKYNIALDAARQGGDDMAILQLKKVISLHPNFIRARQLLALLYIHTGQKERARKQLNYAAQIDVANTTTLRYLKEITPTAQGQKESESAGENELAIDEMKGGVRLSTAGNYSEDKPNVMAWVMLVVGTLVGILVTFILIVPTARKNIRAEFEAVNCGSRKRLSLRWKRRHSCGRQSTRKCRENFPRLLCRSMIDRCMMICFRYCRSISQSRGKMKILPGSWILLAGLLNLILPGWKMRMPRH